MSLTLSEAQQIISNAVKEAEHIDQPMNVAVVDSGNNLLAFARMENAWLGSIDIAQSKAFTARAFDMPTSELGEMAQNGKPLFGINSSNEGKVIIFGGGLPIKKDGKIVGAVGVSGGTVDQDVQVVNASVKDM